jgi:hypothetical protein
MQEPSQQTRWAVLVQYNCKANQGECTASVYACVVLQPAHQIHATEEGQVQCCRAPVLAVMAHTVFAKTRAVLCITGGAVAGV